jgi:geranylgeranylglycerol-phosphate geranylgeranyltransferase
MLTLFRPELSLAAGICVLAGQVLALGGLPPLRAGLLGFLCVFALSGAALILNDYFDYEVDRINAPERPLPSGAVSKAQVLWLTALTSLVGLAAALALGPVVLVFALLVWIVGVLYNARFKQAGLLGNLMVCTSVAGTFLLGAMTVGQPWNGVVWVFSLMAFFIDLGEEIAGDAMDMEGDRARGSRSIALLKGKGFAVRLAAALWGVVILLSLVPTALGWLGASYLVFILLTDAIIVFFSMRLLRSQTPSEGRKAMRGVYLGATLTVAAFMLGQLLI